MKLKPIPKHWQAVIEADPDSAKAKEYIRIQKKINTVNATEIKANTVRKKSTIGNKLKYIFETNVGVIPCGSCKSTIIRMNMMTVEEVLEKKEKLIEDIFSNLGEVKLTLIQQLTVKSDIKLTGGKATKFFIGMWIEEACNNERKEQIKSSVLDNDDTTTTVDSNTE